ncbi:MAG: NRDE family protein [Panacagrimonas sp.]
MCLIAFAWKAHPVHRLLLVANRDEFHAREATPLAWWKDHHAPNLLAGRDLQEGGAWLGVSRSGRMAAVTNVRGPDVAVRKPLSRGQLVADFLRGEESATAFADRLEHEAQAFGGFNLLLYDGAELRYLSNRPRFLSEDVAPGVHALSNAQLDTPWPKARAAHAVMDRVVARAEPDPAADEAALLAVMAGRAPAPDEALPLTGVSLEMERLLSPPFIHSPAYGTRCTSLIRIGTDGQVTFLERRFDATGQSLGDTRLAFAIEAASAP